jgi:hypothetical protein
MKFNIKALAIACAILWGGAVLVVALVNLICVGYAQRFLELLASFYPGYHATRSIGEVILVTLYAIADGLIGGAVFGWLYNRLAR